MIRMVGGRIGILFALASVLVLLVIVFAPSRRLQPASLGSHDTELDKAYFKESHKMCCGPVPWPCCGDESCCDKWKSEGLDAAK